eukprot:TRINITY_DN3770_c0_g1_i1.p1 TRINITY_DN3770_c0_g1~~TRINITY_DN3770_c0_g1_i1.p1  ORF type:complete len:256 (-),score=43.38 TRINITY_DN3770_c0_g1_i1:42-809(-)
MSVGLCSGQNAWGCLLGSCMTFFAPCGLCRKVREVEDGVVLVWGEYQGTITEPGLYCLNPAGLEIRRVSRQKQSVHLHPTKIVDKTGTPLMVSGIVVYYFSDPKKIALEIRDPIQYVSNAAQAILKGVVSKYPFESTRPGQLSLRLNSRQIAKDLATSLNADLNDAGIHVVSFQFNELSYATEVVQGMLKRQQAAALVAARTKIVAGAVDVALMAVDDLEKQGMGMKPEDKAKIVTNLLTLISSENEGQDSQAFR